MKKRIVSLILAAVLCVSLLPAAAPTASAVTTETSYMMGVYSAFRLLAEGHSFIDGGVLKLTDNVSEKGALKEGEERHDLTVPAGRSLTIDLNSYDMEINSPIVVKGALTLHCSYRGNDLVGEIRALNDQGYIRVEEGGTLTLQANNYGSAKCKVINYGTIKGNVADSRYFSLDGVLENYGSVQGGMIGKGASITNYAGGEITGGSFYYSYTNITNYGTISGGLLWDVVNHGQFIGGDVRNLITNYDQGTFAGGKAVVLENKGGVVSGGSIKMTRGDMKYGYVVVSFDMDGGEPGIGAQPRYGAPATQPTELITKTVDETVYYVAGWTLNGQDYPFTQNVDRDITLKPKWAPLAPACKHETLDEEGTCTSCRTKAAAKIGNTYYTHIQDAVDAVQNDETIYILQQRTMYDASGSNYQGVRENVVVDREGVRFTIRLNNTVAWAAAPTGTCVPLTIKAGEVTLTSHTGNTICQQVTYTDREGTEYSHNTTPTAAPAVKVEGGKLTLDTLLGGLTLEGSPAIKVTGGELTLSREVIHLNGGIEAPEGQTALDYLAGGLAYYENLSGPRGTVMNGTSSTLGTCAVAEHYPCKFDQEGGACVCGRHPEAAHTHYICGGESCTGTGHTCSETAVFQPWYASDGLPQSEGYYYLTQNVTLTQSWTPPRGVKTVLCLNGKTITANFDGATIATSWSTGEQVPTLALTDCQESCGSVTHASGKRGSGVYVGQSTTLALYGGSITGNTAVKNGGGIDSRGSVELYGGSITGNKATEHGGGVYIGGFFTMYGGTISNNEAAGYGGGVYYHNTASRKDDTKLLGGEIKNNKAAYGGGLTGGQQLDGCIVGGAVSITDNTATAAGPNLYLRESATLQIDKDHSLTGSIGLSAEQLDSARPQTVLFATAQENAAAAAKERFTFEQRGYEIQVAGNNLKLVRTSVECSAHKDENNDHVCDTCADLLFAKLTHGAGESAQTAYYESLQEALSAVTALTGSAATVTLLRDEASANPQTPPLAVLDASGKMVTLALGGRQFSGELTAKSGALVVTGEGRVTSLVVEAGCSVALYGGTYVKMETKSGYLSQLLPSGYTFEVPVSFGMPHYRRLSTTSSVDHDDGYTVTVCPHQDFEDGVCLDCGLGAFVAQIGTVRYPTFTEAWQAVQPGQTIQLLTDIKLPKINNEDPFEDNKQYTLDLNGKQILDSSVNEPYATSWTIVSGGDVTLTGSGTAAFYRGSGDGRALTVDGGKLTIGGSVTIKPPVYVKNSGTLEIAGGTVELNLTSGERDKNIGGTVNISGGKLNGSLILYKGAGTNISGGTLGSIVLHDNDIPVTVSGGSVGSLNIKNKDKVTLTGGSFGTIKTDVSGTTLLNILPTGKAFFQGTTVVSADVQSLSNVTLAEHTCTYLSDHDGTYRCVCGRTCAHEAALDDGSCAVCGTKPGATLRYLSSEGNRSSTDYSSLAAALTAAKGLTLAQQGCILLNRSTAENVTLDGQLVTLDLNGQAIRGTVTSSSSGKLTILDASAAGCGFVQALSVPNASSLTLLGGSYGKITINNEGTGDELSDLLPGGYVYQWEDGGTKYGRLDRTKEKENVRVLLCPHDSFTGKTCDKCGQERYTVAVYTPYDTGRTHAAYYTSFFTAMSDAGSTDGSLVKLLGTCYSTGANLGCEGTLTLQPNGQLLAQKSSGARFHVVRGTVRIEDAANAGGYIESLCVGCRIGGENPTSGKLVVENASTVMIGLLTIEENGSLVGSAQLSSGQYGRIVMPDGKSCTTLLKAGYAFAKLDDAATIVDARRSTLEGVQVVAHAHDYRSGMTGYCACGEKCPHDAGYNSGEPCGLCGMGKNVVVRIQSGNEIEYYSIEQSTPDNHNAVADEIMAAPDGSVITLLATFQSYKTIEFKNKNLTLDLNGNNFVVVREENGSITLKEGSKLTIRNSTITSNIYVSPVIVESGAELVVEAGKFLSSNSANQDKAFLTVKEGATVTLNGGRFQKIVVEGDGKCIGDLLGPDKAFFALENLDHGRPDDGKTGNHWVTDTSMQAVTNVIVEDAPVAKSKATLTASPSVAGYGTQVTLTASAGTAQTTGYTYQWQEVVNGTATNIPVEETAGTRLTLTPSVGTHTYQCVISKDGFSVTPQCEVTISAANPSTVGFTFPQAAELTYTGEAQQLFTAGSGAPTGCKVYYSVDKTNWETDVTGFTGTNAADYALYWYIQGDEAGNYANFGTAAQPMVLTGHIAPLELVVSATVADKTYDGKTDAAATVSFSANNAACSLVNPEDYERSAAFADADVGQNKTAAVTVTLKSANFTFADEKSTMIVNCTASIRQAAAPTSQPGALTITQGQAQSYSFEFSTLLPTPGTGLRYGPCSYGEPTVALGAYYASGASVDEDGTLTLPIQSASSSPDGPIGTVTVTVQSQNFAPFALTLNVSAQTKTQPITPVVPVVPVTPGHSGSQSGTGTDSGSGNDSGSETDSKPSEGPSGSFDDVPAESYFAPAVDWATEQGVTGGVGSRRFAPEQACTRAQLVTFLYRAAGEPPVKTAENPFVDVDESAYYYKAVLWAVENGITTGTGAASFSPDDPCTRAQAVAFLYRAAGEPPVKTEMNPFADVDKDAYYYKAVLWAVENGITSGTSAATFSPDDPCTRAQIVTLLYRACSQQ